MECDIYGSLLGKRVLHDFLYREMHVVFNNNNNNNNNNNDNNNNNNNNNNGNELPFMNVLLQSVVSCMTTVTKRPS